MIPETMILVSMRNILVLLSIICALGCTPDSANQAPKQPSATSHPIQFVDASARSGVAFRHHAGRSANKLMPEVMGSGVAIADFNRDGAPDLLLVDGGSLIGQAPGSDAGNRLYLNDGKGLFHDATAQWALPTAGYGMGVAVGDYDNDGYVDVFLSHFDGEDLLLRNSGSGFSDQTAAIGIVADGKWSTSAGFFDYDRDGDLDLYLVRYVEFSLTDAPKSYRNQTLIYPTPLLFDGVPDRLWRNDGAAGFVDTSAAVGLAAIPGKGLALTLGDVDLDGWQDAYVSNDSEANRLWLSRPAEGDAAGAGWQEIAQLAGCAYDEQGVEQGSMGGDFSDFDGNGLPDIAVTNFQLEVTAVYRQSSPLLFNEVADLIGVGRSSRDRLSFGIDFFDADNDGLEELLVANGHIEDNIHLNSDSVSFAQPNSLYHNLGNGHFADISSGAGPALQDAQVSRGLATADLNGDGALDFVISNNDGSAQIAFNETSDAGNFVILWLEGARMNRSAIGARVRARIGERIIERQVMGAQSYLSVSDFRLHFGLGAAEGIDQLWVHWLGGDVQELGPLEHDKFYHLREGGAPVEFVPGQRLIEADSIEG